MFFEMSSWLLLPLSGSTIHTIAWWASWHGRLMVLAWGVALPLGVLAARFFKVMPRQDWPRVLDNKLWWQAHRGLQYGGMVLMMLGLWLAWGHASGATFGARLHRWLGWTVAALGIFQMVGGLARGSKGGPTDTGLRGDHYDMTRWRKGFERLHKSLGYLALLLALATLALGLVVADAPRWMALGLAGWWLVLLAAFAWLQSQGRSIDTYQAIWGPDPQHPGNQITPIGWAITRYTSASFTQRFTTTRKKTR